MSPTETPMAASVARFVARLMIRLPSTISRSARKAPAATRYHPIRRFRRRDGSKGSVVAIASSSQPLAAHLADSWNGIGARMMWMRRHGGGMGMATAVTMVSSSYLLRASREAGRQSRGQLPLDEEREDQQ